MNIKFKNIIAHNFLSIGDISLDLANRGFTLVEGINKKSSDNALSNGAGKSTIFNAICWCLTGETIQGLKSNIPNLYGEDGCFVELNFTVDKDDYKIIRYREYAKIKNNLKIFINGEDKSGKSLKASENLLEHYLPYIRPTLIGNIIILGQGLPHKFSAQSPSGRKELLEVLSNSDVMFQDIKDRVSFRQSTLEKNLREIEDKLLVLNSDKVTASAHLNNLKSELEALIEPDQSTIDKYTAKLEDVNKTAYNSEEKLKKLNRYIEKLEKDITEESDLIKSNIDTHYKKYNTLIDDARQNDLSIKFNIRQIEGDIERINSIVDICPTCGQIIPNVVKIDPTSKYEELEKLKEESITATTKLNSLINERQLIADQINKESKLNELEESKSKLRSELSETSNKVNNLLKESALVNSQLATLKNEFKTYSSTKKLIETNINTCENNITEINDSQEHFNSKLISANEHIDTINKINTLVRRDFRGILLTNVIDFINDAAKEYCIKVFNTDDIHIYLDGNNLNIDFCHKALENLSGGEQQRINLIIQLAIRKMMCQYLNFSSNIVVLDEIFDNLDALGCSKVVDLINTSLTDVDSLFIISHHSDELNIPYDDKITIVKDETGVSRLV